MKKVLFGFVVLGMLISCSTAKKVTPIVVEPIPVVPLKPVNPLTNDVDSMSYALGMNLGTGYANNLKTIPGGKVNKDLIIKAFTETLKEDTNLLMTNEKSQDCLRDYFTKAQAQEAELKKAEGEKFLAANKLNDSVQTTASGLQYIVQRQGNGEKPNETDTVTVNYEGSLMDGTVFDSSYKRGEPIEFPLNGVIPGWTEGVQLMNVGSKYKLFIPYNLAYGEQGIQQAGIPPYSPLIFEVELLGIKKAIPKSQVEEIKSDVKTTSKKISTKKK